MPDLPKRTLGRTGLEVTTLGYGAMELRGEPRGRPVTPEQAQTILNTVLDSGINYIDTSIDYGQSEEMIGRFISQRRSEYYLASKCGCVYDAPPAARGQGMQAHTFTRDNIVGGIEQSLRRLKTDHIDVMQFHASPSQQTLEENDAVNTLRELQRDGKIRFIAMSGTLPNIVEQIKMGVFDAFQIPYSALQREHEAVIAEASRAGAGIIIRGGAARGAPSEEKQSGETWDVWQHAGLDDLLDGMNRMEFILRFTFTHPDLDTNIVGTQNLDHLRKNIEIVQKGPLPAHVYEEAKRRLEAAGAVPQPV